MKSNGNAFCSIKAHSGWPKCADCTDFIFFLVLKLYGFFFKLYGLYGILAWKYTFPPFFDSFQQICMKIFKKKSCHKEVGFTCFLKFK